MKIVQCFNVGGNGILLAAGLLEQDIDCDLIIASATFRCAHPAWYDHRLKELLRGRIYRWDIQNPLDPTTRMRLVRMLNRYDVCHLHPPGALYGNLIKKPYLIFDSGTVRDWSVDKGISLEDIQRGKDQHKRWDRGLIRRGYKQAHQVCVNDCDTLPKYFHKMPWLPRHKLLFTPTPLDAQLFHPPSDPDPREYTRERPMIIYHPSRQEWHYKGNDQLIEGFAQFMGYPTPGRGDWTPQRNPTHPPHALLYMTRWGSHTQMTHVLTQKLGIEKHIRWLNPLPKPQLAQAYQAADLIADQFTLGAIGGVANEGMATGKPILGHTRKQYYQPTFGKQPPILQCQTPNQIRHRIADTYYNGKDGHLKRLAEKARQWVLKYHHYPQVTKRIIHHYEEACA